MITKEHLIDILKCGVQAPSGDNSQPWKFAFDGERLTIFNLPERDNPILNYQQFGSYVAHGGLIENIVIASKKFGYDAKINLFPEIGNNEKIAHVFFESAKEEEEAVFSAIENRATNRRAYEERLLSMEAKSELISVPSEIGFSDKIKVALLEDKEAKTFAAAAGSSIERVILENRLLHEHLFKNVRWSAEEEARAKSGLYIDTMEFGPPQRFIFRLARKWAFMKVANFFGLPKFIAREDAKIYATGAAFGCLLLKDDANETIINSGRVFQRLWLRATNLGLSLQPVTALAFVAKRIINNEAKVFSDDHKKIIKENFEKMQRAFNVKTEHITMPFRVGFATPPSARSSRKMPDIIFE